MADIHPQLQQDCLVLGKFPLSYLLLMNDSSYPWFILVPDRENITEIYHLSKADQHQLWEESRILSQRLMQSFLGDKLNVAAIGNLVPQLHLHHVVRFQHDRTWPAPVWGKFPPIAYSDRELHELFERLNLISLKGFIK